MIKQIVKIGKNRIKKYMKSWRRVTDNPKDVLKQSGSINEALKRIFSK